MQAVLCEECQDLVYSVSSEQNEQEGAVANVAALSCSFIY